MDDLFIWIVRWDEFQHYKPDRDRPPAWIKDYVKQMNDERYLRLSDRQRAILGDIRRIRATTGPWLTCDASMIGRHRHRQTRHSDLEALRDAGFLEFVSRATLEKRLEKLYSRSSLEVEGEKEGEGDSPKSPQEVGTYTTTSQPRTTPRAAGTNPRAVANSDKEQAHLELIREATRIAANWNGKDSLAFDEELDQLQADYRAQLTFVERDDLWDKAFKR